MLKLINFLGAALWSFPLPVLLMGTHIYFTFRLGFIQKYIPQGIRDSFFGSRSTGDARLAHSENKNRVSPYAALATSLAATIGTGNIIGISAAIAIGGPGAVFWCWITGVLGIATCYSECLLSVLFRKQNGQQYFGGPMYVLKNGLHHPKTASFFALAAVLVSLGMGSSVQSHSMCSAVLKHVPVSPHLIGMAAAVLAGFVILGGITQISRICSFFVPLMSVFYLAGCFFLLYENRAFLADAFAVIFRSAFSSRSFTGGISGTAVMICMRTGISRGLFTNEAGLGSIPMAAASADAASPVRQSLISMTGPFWDTVVICAVTGLTIVSSMLHNPGDYQGLPADALCFTAFSRLPLWGTEILSVSLILFAFATILGWCCYGECGIRFLLGEKGIPMYHILYLFFIYLGAVIPLNLVWGISDLFNALMTLPNLLCLWLLRDRILKETRGLNAQHSRVSYSSRK